MSSGGSSSKGRKIVLKGLFNKNLSIPKPKNNKEFQNNVSDSVVAFAELPQGQIESLNIGNLDDDRLRIMGRSIQANDIDDPQLGAVGRHGQLERLGIGADLSRGDAALRPAAQPARSRRDPPRPRLTISRAFERIEL